MIANQIRLPGGEVSLELQVQTDNLDERFRVRSIELTPVDAVPASATESKTAHDSLASDRLDGQSRLRGDVPLDFSLRTKERAHPAVPGGGRALRCTAVRKYG